MHPTTFLHWMWIHIHTIFVRRSTTTKYNKNKASIFYCNVWWLRIAPICYMQLFSNKKGFPCQLLFSMLFYYYKWVMWLLAFFLNTLNMKLNIPYVVNYVYMLSTWLLQAISFKLKWKKMNFTFKQKCEFILIGLMGPWDHVIFYWTLNNRFNLI